MDEEKNIKIEKTTEEKLEEESTIKDRLGRIERPEERSPYKTKPLWCPYCGMWSTHNKKTHKMVCCGVTTKEFNIRKANPGRFW